MTSIRDSVGGLAPQEGKVRIRGGYAPKEPGDAIAMYPIPRDAETRLLIGKLQPFATAVGETEQLRLQLEAAEETDDPRPRVP